MPILSPALTCSESGPRVKDPWVNTAALSVETTELDREAEPMLNSHFHYLRGSSTSPSWAIRLSIRRTFCAGFSLHSVAALRRILSLSGAFIHALCTPWLDHSRCVLAREQSS